ncbi:MAG TPA: cation diffusion facilitator family transporter [Spirochaetia bacterium]|nr:cation diffusion facilitator family transporter [Spirochaetia bacterium]
MRLSLATGLFMFAVKVSAFVLTGSAAILSDAAESVVHVAAVFFAAYSLRLSYKPADPSHLYGHTKIVFFSAGFEGAMIFLAGLFIIYESTHKWIIGLRLEHLGIGTVLTAVAVITNAALGLYLVRLGKRKKSLIILANGRHVLTDVWTSLAVLVALLLTLLTGWLPFDPICGILMALNILRSGGGLMRSAFAGLMDAADPDIQKQIIDILDVETQRRGLIYHELRHRNIGDSHWVEVHLVFPQEVPLGDAHRTATEIERIIERQLPAQSHVTTHLESGTDHAESHGEG